MKNFLSIIIVSFNTKELLYRCLKSLDHNDEIIVVDNGSSDGSVETIKSSEFKNLKIIVNKNNLGFAKAVNQGIKVAQGEKILLLNSDIIAKKGAIKKLLDFMDSQPQAGVVGGKLLNLDGSPQGSCFYLPTLVRVIREFLFNNKKISIFNKYTPLGESPSEVESVIGAVFLISRKVIEKIGFLDERYFMYFEDLDYCRRVNKAGYKVYYLSEAEFIHAHGASGKNISNQTHKWLVESSQVYHGKFKYYLINFIIRIGQKLNKKNL